MARQVRASAPARANLIGNPSDQYAGTTLSCSLPLRAHARVEAADETEIRIEQAVLRIGDPAELVPRGDDFDLGRVALASLGAPAGVSLSYDSEVPAQSGVGGSSALLVALLGALGAWLERPREPSELAEAAREVEWKLLGIQCGFVDHYMAAYGGLRFLDFAGKAGLAGEGPGPFATVESLVDRVPRLPFLLAFTGVRHHSGSVHAPIRRRFERGEAEVVRAYERVGELGRLGRAALLAADWRGLSELMNENHAIQRELGGSGAPNEAMITAARDAGAPAAKLAGAGDGGTVVALWLDDDFAPLEAAFAGAGAAALWRPRPLDGLVVEDFDAARASRGAGAVPRA
ncbi:MAG: hypothetical protein HRU00_14750 [Myxococcales bacterium]|nr:hypothetical protein [Myxococcales bacterium]